MGLSWKMFQRQNCRSSDGFIASTFLNNLELSVMKPYTSLKSILAEFFPLHRTLVSDDHDKTLEIIGSYMPDSSNYTIETYAPLTSVWTWKVQIGRASCRERV